MRYKKLESKRGMTDNLRDNQYEIERGEQYTPHAEQVCANCNKPYGDHLLHDGNKCSLGSVMGWFPKALAVTMGRLTVPEVLRGEGKE